MNKYLAKLLNTTSVPYTVENNVVTFTEQRPIVPTVGHYYIVKFARYILFPYEGLTLHANYNNNIPPHTEYMEIEVWEVSDTMVRINGVGFDPDTGVELRDIRWNGYIPLQGITFLREIY